MTETVSAEEIDLAVTIRRIRHLVLRWADAWETVVMASDKRILCEEVLP